MKNQLHALRKLCLSVRKRDWELSDYPVVVREQEVDPNYSGKRLKQYRYIASIVNWAPAGAGETEQEAIQALDTSLASAKAERVRSGRSLPRPGTRVPVEFSSQERVGAHPALAENFIQCVLNLDWAWISDESSLWDFHREETNDALISRIKEVYGVDVSDIQSARLCEILERIAARQQST
jgi:hypothetical protein